MTDTKKIVPLKELDKNLIWKGLYAVAMLLVCGGLYWATTQTNYIWRWNRIPQYFYYIDTVKVTAEIEGEVSSITK